MKEDEEEMGLLYARLRITRISVNFGNLGDDLLIPFFSSTENKY